MAIHLNHTIVHTRDRWASARFLADILGLGEPKAFGPFVMVETDNGVSLDFMDTGEDIASQHYAFLISEDEFDEVFARVTQRDLDYWADPGARHLREINHGDGGRGFYFADPSGHWLEVLTRPYGSGS
jgi:extradiol dioxygenase family protein